MSTDTQPSTPLPSGASTMSFGALTIAYDESVLEPRPWTLAQSTWAAELLVRLPAGDVLELCCGVGHIGLAATVGSSRHLVQVDDAPRACALARRNAADAGVDAEVREGRFAQVLADGEEFALVVADPPWVPTSRVGDHPADPRHAIDGGLDGLEVARTCLRTAAEHLRPGGAVLLQLGTTGQVDVLDEHLASLGLAVVEVRQEERGVLVLLERTVD